MLYHLEQDDNVIFFVAEIGHLRRDLQAVAAPSHAGALLVKLQALDILKSEFVSQKRKETSGAASKVQNAG